MGDNEITHRETFQKLAKLDSEKISKPSALQNRLTQKLNPSLRYSMH